MSRNKKEYQAKFLGMNSQTWLTIGILITIILVIFGINTYLNQPKFSVLKTECHTKELPCQVIEYHNKSIYACPQYYVEVNESVISNVSVQLPQVCEDKKINYQDNLEWSQMCYDLCDFRNINTSSEECFNSYGREFNTQGHLGCGQSDTFKDYKNQKIWLDENCNCTNREYPEYYAWQKEGCDKYAFKSACNDLKASYNRCLEYQCGNFKVVAK